MTRNEGNDKPTSARPSAFSAERLTLARQRRGLTKKHLAERVGVTPQAITSFEDGSCAPAIGNAVALARELEFDVEFFYEQDVDLVPVEAVSFRSRRTMTCQVRDRTIAAGTMAAGLISPAFAKRFRLPDADIPDLQGEKPEVAADNVRARWGLGQGPVTDMVCLLEAVGVGAYWFEEASTDVDAVSFWRDGKPYVLVSRRSRGGERIRFDLAHELGHLVLHRNGVDLGSRDTELEATRFAAAFLLPERQFRLECPLFPTLNQLLQLKPRWKVSVQAMIMRSKDLKLLSTWQYQRMFRDVGSLWGRMSEPNSLASEESALHTQVFERLSAKGIHAEDFANDIHLTISDLVGLVPAADRFRRTRDEREPPRLTIEELGYRPPT